MNAPRIHVALRMGHKEIVRLLLQYGASLTSRTESGNTALHLDSEVGHLISVKYTVELDTAGMEVQIIERNNNALGSWKCRCKIGKIFGSKDCAINAESTNGAPCFILPVKMDITQQ